MRLRATRWPGSGTPVLLLHGLASSRHIWDLVVPHLSGLSVVALDQRGHGDSERPSGPYDGATVTTDALTALDALGISRAVVVGHSWGAWTALRLAAEVPGRVLSVVALDGGIRRIGAGEDLPREELRRRMEPPRTALPLPDVLARMRSGPLGPWWSPAVEQAQRALLEVGPDGLARSRFPFEAHMQVVDDLLDARPEDWFPAVRCPAWLVSCEPHGPDPLKGEALERAGALLSRGRLQRWGGALHDVPLQWPALVAGLVRAAATEVDGSGEVPGAGPEDRAG